MRYIISFGFNDKTFISHRAASQNDLDLKKPKRTPLHHAADVGNMLISCLTSTNQQSADQGLMIWSSVPEDPTGETDCSTCVLFQDNK